MNRQFSHKTSRAFSLVEIVIVIAVIGILSSLSVPALSKVRSSAKELSAKRNAQEAASLSAAADAAGVTHVFPELAGGVEATLALLSSGISGVSDSGLPIFLRLNLSETEIADASRFLSLRYTSSGITMEYHNIPIQ